MSWETRGPSAAITALLLVTLALQPACRGLPESVAAHSKDAGTTQRTATPAPPKEQVYARHWVVSYRLDPVPIGSFARLKDRERQVLDHMIDHSWARWQVYAHAGRVLLRPPPRHPLGSVELLIADDTGSVTVFEPGRRLQHTLPRERLPDLLDGVRASERADFTATLQPTAVLATDRVDLHRHVKLRAYTSELTLRYLPRSDRSRAWPLRLRLRLLMADNPRPWPFQQPLLHVALPLLQDRRGLLALEGLAWQSGGQPLGWSLSAHNEGQPSGLEPRLVAQVEEHGYRQLRLDRFEEQRPGYSVSRSRPGTKLPGAQLVPAERLMPLRHDVSAPQRPALKTKRASPDTRQGLTLDNRSKHTSYVYIDGAQVGWVAPRERFTFKGMPPGYYRVFCVSPTLVRSWGPHDIYLPGPLTLR